MIDSTAIAAQAARLRNVPRTVTAPAAPVVTETLRITPVAAAAYLLKDDSAWTAEDLRDYVMGQVEAFHGPQPRNTVKEMAIFKAFLGRWGAKAPAIARFVFEVQRGMWRTAPVSVNRFTVKCDPYFADVIADRLP